MAAPDEKMAEWMRSIDADIAQLKSRRLQGALAVESISIADGSIVATRSTPLKLAGSKTWTAAVEYLGANPPGANNGADALVLRDEFGVIRDMFPRPFIQLGGGAVVAVAAGAVTTVPMTGANPSSSPFAASVTTTTGQLILPVAGEYIITHSGQWPNVLGTNARVTLMQYSVNGGASFVGLESDGRTGINSASFGQQVTITAQAVLPAGTRIRIQLIHESATTPLNYTPLYLAATFMRGPL